MQKFSYRHDWVNRWDIVGFDLDGTLYDEREFIAQVYRPISERLASETGEASQEIYQRILALWIEKGSSYNRIFDEVLRDAGISDSRREKCIAECLSIFRTFQPVLHLDMRVASFLDEIVKTSEIFLATDGQIVLQQAKIDALNLQRWFEPENIVISMQFGPDAGKPSTRMLEGVRVLKNGTDPSRILYLGDRHRDRLMAERAGFEFLRVS